MADETTGSGDPKKPGQDESGPDDVRSTDWSGAPLEPPTDASAAPDAPAPSPPTSPTPAPAVDWAGPASSTPPPTTGWAAAPAQPPGAPPSAAWDPTAPAPPVPPSAPPPPVGWAAVAPPPPPAEIAPGLTFGSTGRRFVAFLLDQIVLVLLAIVIGLIVAPLLGSGGAGSVVSQLLASAISLAYFVGTWRSSARATPGMRLLKLQVGNAFDGRVLTTEQAIRRWVALGEPLGLLFATTATAGIGGLALLVWSIVLLITTATSPTKQGLHDRFANSAVVEPAGIGNGAVIGCIVLLVIVFIVLPLISIIGLISVGGEVTRILSAVGSPAP